MIAVPGIFDRPRVVHLVGAGGVGMSSLGQALLHSGHRVSGSDSSDSERTRRLARLGATIALGHAGENVPVDADLVIVAARTAPEKKERGITLFGVDTTSDGYSRGRKLDKVGQEESDTAELFFENVRVSDDDIVGERDRFLQVVGDEDDRRPGLLPQAEQLVRHDRLGLHVKRAERLVHQQDRRLVYQRGG